MKFNLLKSKILTGTLAIAMTVAMVPSMAMAEDAISEETTQGVESVAETSATIVDAETTQVRTDNNLQVVDPANVASIVVSGANVVTYTVSTTNSDNGNTGNKTYTYNIVLAPGTLANAQLTATFAKAAGSSCTISKLPRISSGPFPTIPVVLNNQSLEYPINLQDGEGTATAYLFPNLTGNFTRFDTYKFVYTIQGNQQVSIGFGDPEFPATQPESDMTLGGSVPNFEAVYNGSTQGYYPDVLTVRIEGANELRTENGTNNVCFVEYDLNGTPTELAVPTNQSAPMHTIRIKHEGRIVINNNSYLKFFEPQAGSGNSGGTPSVFKGYLPMGQFATGEFWGTPFTNGNTQVGTTAKIVNGFAGTGMSLGAAGGYAEYDMHVVNDAKNKYGVDFIVYGNAFNGNPEAGSVKVYGTPVGSNTPGWYELAGSLYYRDETLRNVNVSYKKDGDAIQYRLTKGDLANPTQLQNWKLFGGSKNWLPTAEKYNRVKGNVDDVIANLGTADTTEVTYGGVTLVRDTDTNSDYAFGYFDVASNGAANNVPVNPYAAGNVGANGFDISWAVNGNGEPVKLTEISKIRVYTSAVLNIATPDHYDFTTPAIFGETSAELCGIFEAGDKSATPVGVTTAPVVKKEFSTLVHQNGGIQTVTTNSNGQIKLKITSQAENVYVNGARVNATGSGHQINMTLNPQEVKYVQVIAQTGNKEPYVTVFKLVRN